MSEESEGKESRVDRILRSMGYDPVQLGKTGQVFAEVCFKNEALKSALREVITSMDLFLNSEDGQQEYDAIQRMRSKISRAKELI